MLEVLRIVSFRRWLAGFRVFWLAKRFRSYIPAGTTPRSCNVIQVGVLRIRKPKERNFEFDFLACSSSTSQFLNGKVIDHRVGGMDIETIKNWGNSKKFPWKIQPFVSAPR